MKLFHPKHVPLVRYIIDHNWHRHPLFIPVATFLVLFFASSILLVATNGQPVTPSDSHTIYLSYDNKHSTLPTRAQTVGEFLERAGVTLSEGDIVEPAKDTTIAEDNFHVNVYRAEPVLIIDGNQKTFSFSAASTARSIADQAGLKLYPEDKLEADMTDGFLKDGSIGRTVVVDRAVPADLNVYGTQLSIRTHAKTVGDLLKEKNVVLAKDDTVLPAAETPLESAKQIFVTRSGTKVETKEETIAMKVEYVEDAKLSFGTTAVRQAGSAGKRLVTYQIELKNDKEVSRRVIQTVTAQEAVTQIVARGKAVNIPGDKESVMAAAGISPSDYAYVNYIISRESGWNAAASNRSSGAFGLCQALPGSKMASAGSDWQTNPVTQLRWCSGYAKKFGGWAGAYDYWLVHHWW